LNPVSSIATTTPAPVYPESCAALAPMPLSCVIEVP